MNLALERLELGGENNKSIDPASSDWTAVRVFWLKGIEGADDICLECTNCYQLLNSSFLFTISMPRLLTCLMNFDGNFSPAAFIWFSENELFIRKFSFISIFFWFIPLDVSSEHVSSLITLERQAQLFLRDWWPWMLRRQYYTTFLYARVIGRSKTYANLSRWTQKISAPWRFIDKIADFHKGFTFLCTFR